MLFSLLSMQQPPQYQGFRYAYGQYHHYAATFFKQTETLRQAEAIRSQQAYPVFPSSKLALDSFICT